MTAPHIPILFPLPQNGGIPQTYAELNRSMSCTCQAGAIIKPSIPPIPGFNLGDIIADQSKLLAALAAGYGMLAVVMKLVSCIIDVLCALVNPFAVIAALIRLFGSCLPDFILLLPQLAIPAMILCVIKIILAIVTYVVTVIIPLLQDVIANVQDLIEAMATGNEQAAQAVAFKIVSILKELMNVVGILAALDAVLAMVKALLGLGIGIPCGGGGGSCGGCGDDQCPPVFENRTLSGTDGVLTATAMFGGGSLEYLVDFASAAHKENFLALAPFFPTGIDYAAVTDTGKLPYWLSCDGDYAVASVVASDDEAENGKLELVRIPDRRHSDGYLSSIYNSAGVPTDVDPTGQHARFGTRAANPQFSAADAGNTYLEVADSDSEGALKNSGIFMIASVYDGYNARLDHLATGAWDIQNSYNPTTGKGSKVVWRKVAMPLSASSRPYTLTINHEELIRRSIIGVGCHPDVRAAVRGARNRSPDLDIAIPALPDIDGYGAAAMACITAIAPIDVDSQYVIDNYGSIAQAATTAGECVTDTLGALAASVVSYAGEIYPRLFSPDKSLLYADRDIQVVGGDIVVSIVPVDINGNRLADDLPPGVVDVGASTTFGTLSDVVEILDAYGVSTGEFRATLASGVVGVAEVTATVAGRPVADFDATLATPDYVVRKLTLSFVESRPVDMLPRDSREPLGTAGTGGAR
jgi:hypothetical protein